MAPIQFCRHKNLKVNADGNYAYSKIFLLPPGLNERVDFLICMDWLTSQTA